MAWNIFKNKNKKNEEENRFKKVANKLNDALTTVQTKKRETAKKIEELKTWSSQVIIETYPAEFPNGNMTFYQEQYKQKALNEYQDIKKKYENEVDKSTAERCEKILTGYNNHIKLRSSELELYEKLEKKYTTALSETKSMKIGEQGQTILGKHEERLRNMNDGSNSYVKAVSEQEKYKNLNDALEYELTYVQQLEKISSQMEEADGGDIDNTQAFKDELEKITNEL